MQGPAPDAPLQRAYRVRISVFLLGVALALILLSAVYQTVQTLNQLAAVERERDQWQRPSDIVQALNLRNGNLVADVGSGVGYFALKLSPVVGRQGEVLATDIRRLPLLFLRLRAFAVHQQNIRFIHGQADDPHLPAGGVDAVLVANTYHELARPGAVLDCIFRSLNSSGRLVVADRYPESVGKEISEAEAPHHGVSPALAEQEIRRSGFHIVNRQDRFIDRPGEGSWWLVVAVKP